MKKINRVFLIIFLMVIGMSIYFINNSLADTTLSENIYQGANNQIYIYTIQQDGKIIIGGDFSTYNGTSRNRIARLNSDGSLDTSFNPGSGLNNMIRSMCEQQDGKIIIGGDFTTYNGTSRNRIARLNSDGSLDASFNIGNGVDNSIYNCSIQPDGKIIIVGDFTKYNDTGRGGIARLNSDGSLDTSFNPGSGARYSVYSSAIQQDGKIIIGGDFSTYNGTSRNRIARLNSDGSLDTSFNPGSGADRFIRFLTIGSGGKIIIGGDFTTYNGTSSNRIARLNSDGSLDTSFNPGSGADYAIYSIYRQQDNKLIINGYFSTYNGTSRNHIARLNSDGSLDTSFNPNLGADSAIFFSKLDLDGGVIIVGKFTMYNGQMRNYIARLNWDASLDNSFNKQNLSFWTRGSWVKSRDTSAVYFIDMNQVRHAYINESIWYSYFDSNTFFTIPSVSSRKLESYPLGKNVPFNANSLVKVPSIPKVYRISASGALQWIKTENAANRLYGPNWNTLIYDISETSFRDYEVSFSIE
ncbi:MAG: delta-60 repeat domain-containing protein [Patescibacteria group bacterium]|nr:delta-60 repeat domain-containing protein [Patescibacteria group bacterium]